MQRARHQFFAVPLSPLISTAALLGDHLPTRENTSCMAPTAPPDFPQHALVAQLALEPLGFFREPLL